MPVADPNRVVRAVLQPAECGRLVPEEPPDPGQPGSGDEICIDFGPPKPGTPFSSQANFQ